MSRPDNMDETVLHELSLASLVNSSAFFHQLLTTAVLSRIVRGKSDKQFTILSPVNDIYAVLSRVVLGKSGKQFTIFPPATDNCRYLHIVHDKSPIYVYSFK